MVGNKHCSYGLCNSDARYNHKDHMKDVYFVPFPKPQRNFIRCQQWVRACGRAEFTIANIKRNSYICSRHFDGGRGPTTENPDPIPFEATEDEIRENEMRGRVGKSHRKRINLAVPSAEAENEPRLLDSADGSLTSPGSTSQYYTLVTLPSDASKGIQASRSTPEPTNNSSVSAPKLLLISQPQVRKGKNKQSGSQTTIIQSILGNDTTPTEQDSPKNTTSSSGGQIVAVKNFVIHGQKYTAVHINPEGKPLPLVKASTSVKPRRKVQQDTGNGIFFSKNNVMVTVPSPWCVQQETSTVTFRRISQSDSVLLSLAYHDTKDLVLRVLGMEITSHPILECMPSPIKLSDISFVLKQFERWRVCIGNPDEKFQAVFHQRPKSSAFYSWIDDSVHSKSCELLSLKERCTPCKNYRGYLRCVLNREQKKLGKDVAIASSNGREVELDDSEEQMSE